MRFKIVFVVVFILVGLVVSNCGGSQAIPTAPSVVTSPEVPPVPPNFTFVRVGNSGSSWDLPVWGLRGDNSETSVKQMVFCDAEGGSVMGSPNPGGFRTLSHLVGPTTIVFRQGDFSDEQIEKVRAAAQYMENITGFQMAVDTKLVVGNRVGLIVDPTIKPTAQIALYSPRVGGPITTADISIRSADVPIDHSIKHELGHLIGMCHHNFRGLMGNGGAVGASQDFSTAELDNAVVMYKLPVTTPFPGEKSSMTSSLSSGFGSSQMIVIED